MGLFQNTLLVNPRSLLKYHNLIDLAKRLGFDYRYVHTHTHTQNQVRTFTRRVENLACCLHSFNY